MLHRLTGILDKLLVYPERMKANIARTGDLFFSQRLMLALAGCGLTREQAYRLVQRHAMATWTDGGSFKEHVVADPEVTARLSREELDAVFDLDHYLGHVDTIFSRVFGEDSAAARTG
jgi:adenylosuccinate lyase